MNIIHRNVIKNELTPREKEVFKLLGYPLSWEEIAQKTSLTKNTAKQHAKIIYDKLGLAGIKGTHKTRIQAAILSLQYHGNLDQIEV